MILDRMKRLLNVLTLACAAIGLAGCASNNPNADGGFQFPGENAQKPLGASSMLRVGDMITVNFSDVPTPGLQEIKARIPDDGMLTLHMNIRVKAAEKTIPQLEKDIREAFVPRYFRQLTAVVRAEDRWFFVGGEVRTPNRYQLVGELTVLRAIETAGGFTDYAKRTKIELRRENGERYLINERKAKENPALDLPVMANDHITVKRRIF